MHNSPNPGANQHILGWLTNTSSITSTSGHGLHLTLMFSHGGEPSANIVGDLQTFSNIEAGFLYGFYEMYYQFQKDNFWIKVGQQDLNTDLLLTQTGTSFTHSSFGIDPVTAFNFPAPTYPAASFSITSEFRINEGLTIGSGIFDGQFASPNNDFLRLNWSINRDDGLLYLLEPSFKLLKVNGSRK